MSKNAIVDLKIAMHESRESNMEEARGMTDQMRQQIAKKKANRKLQELYNNITKDDKVTSQEISLLSQEMGKQGLGYASTSGASWSWNGSTTNPQVYMNLNDNDPENTNDDKNRKVMDAIKARIDNRADDLKDDEVVFNMKLQQVVATVNHDEEREGRIEKEIQENTKAAARRIGGGG